MLASLAQAVALVAHGNAFLSDPGSSPPDLVARNTAFQYVGALEFRLAPGPASNPIARLLQRPAETPALLATNTGEWLQHARSVGIERFWLVGSPLNHPRMPDHVALAFAGFSAWGILAGQAHGGIWWSGTEALLHPPGAKKPEAGTGGNRIWRVIYTGADAGESVAPALDPAVARARLAKVLAEAIGFTAKAGLPEWREWLTGAAAQLDSPQPRATFHDDMLPDAGYRLEARQLLAAGASAWVFGGMGSWNDMMFDRSLGDDYKRITPALYASVTESIFAAANAFDAANV